jgi:hypothetical protein
MPLRLRASCVILAIVALLVTSVLSPAAAQDAPRGQAAECRDYPVRALARVGAVHPEVGDLLGCTTSPELAISMIVQRFEHGWMLGETLTPAGSTTLIEALFDDDQHYARFDAPNRPAADAQASVDAAPTGLLAAQGPFAAIWRDAADEQVRQRLGWATGPLRVAPGRGQWFERGGATEHAPPRRWDGNAHWHGRLVPQRAAE